MKTAPPFLTLALDGDECSASRPHRFIPWERGLGTYCVGRWAGPTVSVDNVEKRNILFSFRKSNPGCPARSYTNWTIPAPIRNAFPAVVIPAKGQVTRLAMNLENRFVLIS
jgi:hypothetical protein